MPSAGKEMIDDYIKNKAVFVVSKSYCPYCKKTKDILKKYKINKEVFEWLDIDKLDDTEKIQRYMGKLTGAKSVPRVFIGGQFVGGGDETEAAHRSDILFTHKLGCESILSFYLDTLNAFQNVKVWKSGTTTEASWGHCTRVNTMICQKKGNNGGFIRLH